MGNYQKSSQDRIVQIHLNKKSNWNLLVKQRTAESISAISCSQDGKLIALAWLKHISIYNSENGQEVGKIPNLPYYITSIILSRNGQHLVSGFSDGTILIWDTHTRQKIGQQISLRHVRTLLLSNDSQYIAASGDNELKIWNNKDRSTPLMEEGRVSAFDFAPNCKLIIFSHCSQQRIILQNIQTRKRLQYIVRTYPSLSCIKLSPIGKTIAISSPKKIHIYDYQRNKLITQFQGCLDNVMSFYQYGLYLATGSCYGKIRLLDIMQRHCTNLIGHEDEWWQIQVRQIQISPNGKQILSLDSNQFLRVQEIG